MDIRLKQRIAYPVVIALLCLLNACVGEEEITMQGGEIRIALTEDLVDVTESRATPAVLGKPLQNEFHMKVTKVETREVIHLGEFRSRFASVLPGNYTLEVSHGTDVALAYDSPYYTGYAEAIVEDGKTADVSIPVKVANSLISVTFANPEIFDQLYSQYGLRVSVGDNSLIIKSDQTNESAYFPANSAVKVSFSATTHSGTSVSYPLTEALGDILPLEAAEHATIRLEAANVGVNVTKVEVENVTVEETLPLEWLPQPKFSVVGFEDNKMEFVETERKEAKINYTLASPLQDAEISFNFDAPQYPELMALNDDIYRLSEMSESQRTSLQNMGIMLPTIGSTTCQVDLTGLTERMQTDSGASTTNTVTINVKANNRWSNGDKEQGSGNVFTMTVNSPTFTVNAQAEHMWSKEFTMDEAVITTGIVEKIKAGLTYQYLDGSTWKNCNNGRKQKFDTHPSNKIYKVRACYRGAVPSSNIVDVTLETPVQLPNSEMEEWHYTEIDGGWTGTDTPTYFPWNSGANSYWETNNEYTTRYRTWGSVAPYNCFPAVSYTASGHSGRAAELRNTAAGSGNTNAGSASINKDKNKVPGMLFLGALNDDAGTISEKGRAFTSRPSGISFWYTYSPMNNDICDITICWMDNEGNTILESTKQISGVQSSYRQETVSIPIDNEKLYKKVSKLFIQFRSSIYSGSNLPWAKDVSVYAEGYDKTFKTWAGSVLRIDDISLIYDK